MRNSIRVIDTQLRYYLNIQNPEDLSDQEWAEHYTLLNHIRKLEKEQSS